MNWHCHNRVLGCNNASERVLVYLLYGVPSKNPSSQYPGSGKLGVQTSHGNLLLSSMKFLPPFTNNSEGGSGDVVPVKVKFSYVNDIVIPVEGVGDIVDIADTNEEEDEDGGNGGGDIKTTIKPKRLVKKTSQVSIRNLSNELIKVCDGIIYEGISNSDGINPPPKIEILMISVSQRIAMFGIKGSSSTRDNNSSNNNPSQGIKKKETVEEYKERKERVRVYQKEEIQRKFEESEKLKRDEEGGVIIDV